MRAFILFVMIFLHILDDFHLQGILCNMKQKSWWLKQDGYNPMYEKDYIVCLMVHAFSWSFTIMLPCAIWLWNSSDFCFMYFSMFIINMFLHALVDHLKANTHTINLVQDQAFHMMQIFITFVLLFLL